MIFESRHYITPKETHSNELKTHFSKYERHESRNEHLHISHVGGITKGKFGNKLKQFSKNIFTHFSMFKKQKEKIA